MKWSVRGKKKNLVQDDHDDVLRVSGCVGARGSARIEPDECGEREEGEEHGPYHEDKEKLRALVSESPTRRAAA
jgi:hypothetical protein